jgi:RHS repeat-associated protein
MRLFLKCLLVIVVCVVWYTFFPPLATAQTGESAQNRFFQTTYDYDGSGRLAAIYRPDGTQVRYEYGSDKQPLAIVTPEGRTEFKYDKNGNCIEVRNSQGKTEYFYDPFNRLTKVSYNYPVLKKSVAYDYDPWDHLSQVKVLSATGQEEFQTSYEYDVIGRIAAVEAKGQRTTYAYDTAKHIVTCTLPNGIQSEYTYDNYGQTITIEHRRDKDILARFGYTYGINGLLTNAVETVDGNTVTIRYEYDKAERLISAKYSDGRSYTYGYDSMGNRTFAEEPSGRFEAEYDWAGKLKRYGKAELEYDAQGNTTAIREPNHIIQLKYYFANQLSEVVAEKNIVRYQYSAEGLLIARESGGHTVFYLPTASNGMWQPLLDGEGKSYVWANGMAVILQDNKQQYLLNDRLASPRVIFDQQKGSYTTVSYSPFGVCNAYSDNRKLSPGFGGLFHEDAYGLYLTPARAYAPWLGRFLQPDPQHRIPFSSQKDISDYAYCGSDPANYVDKNGAEAKWVWGPENMAWQTTHTNGAFNPLAIFNPITANQWYAQRSGRVKNYIGWWPGADAAEDLPSGMNYKDWDAYKQSGWLGRGAIIHDLDMNYRQRMTHRKDFFGNIFDIGSFSVWGIHAKLLYNWTFGALLPPIGHGAFTNPVYHGPSKIPLDTELWAAPHTTKDTKKSIRASSLQQDDDDWWDDQTKRYWKGPDPPDKFGGAGVPTANALASLGQKWQPPPPRGGGGAVPTQEALLALGDKWQPKGVKFDKPAEFFGQIGAIRGVSYDPQTKQMALIGDGNPNLPSVRLEDFLVAIHVVYGDHAGEPDEPTFSLDPADPTNPTGPWLKAVYMPRLLAGTHMGDVMFNADWVLKQYTFGVIADNKGNILGKRVSSVPGYKSYMEIVTENPSAVRQSEVYSRFWILPLEMKIARKGNTIVFVRSTMQVQTRRMEFTGSGLADSADKSDQCAERFAEHFTFYYDKFAQEAPVLEEVREAAKVVAIVKWLKEQGLGVNDFAIDWGKIPKQDDYIQRVPSLTQSQTVSLWGMGTVTLYLVGGVELAPHIIELPSVPAAQMLDTHIAQGLTGPAGTSAGQFRTDDGAFRYSVLPLTKGAEQILTTRRLAVQDGVTYAADERMRVCQAFDSDGDSATFQYDNEDKLVNASVYTPAGWELQGRAVDSVRRELQVRSPNRDKVLYRFGSDKLLSDVSVNDEVVLRLKQDTVQNAIELQHIKTVDEYKIGDLSAMSKPAKAEKIVATERLIHDKDKLRYTREQTAPGRPKTTAEIELTWTDNNIEIKGTNLGSFSLQKKDADTVVENSPEGQIIYEFKPGTDVIKKVTSQNGDSLEFYPQNNSPDGSNTVVRSTRGSAVAEISASDNSVSVKDYSGNRTTYRYADGFLQQVESPAGMIRYIYSKPGQLEQILFPDNSSLRFSRTQAANISRMTVWRQAASSKKTD